MNNKQQYTIQYMESCIVYMKNSSNSFRYKYVYEMSVEKLKQKPLLDFISLYKRIRPYLYIYHLPSSYPLLPFNFLHTCNTI